MRGKLLGGSSSLNGMVYNRGSQADYDDLVSRGNPGWGWTEMLRIFQTIEDHALGQSEMRGTGGPLHISVTQVGEEVSEALIESAAAAGMKRVDDINGSDEERSGYSPATIRRGLRVSSAKAFLRPALKRPKLTVLRDTTVTGVVFEGDRAVGLRTDSGANDIRATREIILSSGSIATPKLLQLSAIGPRDVLTGASVDVRVDSPRVGEGLHEHRCFPLQMRLNVNKGYNRLLASSGRQALTGVRYLTTRRGPLATPVDDMLTFLRTDAAQDRPNAQVLMAPMSLGSGLPKDAIESRPGLSLLGFVLRPTSEGTVRIRSADPSEPPRIDAGYLQSNQDRRHRSECFGAREIVAHAPIADLLTSEIEPGPAVEDDDSILRAGFLYGGTGYHASGACAMGSADTDVVDHRLRVRGVSGLRIVDVSVMPTMVSGNLNGPTMAMAMAWRAAELILEDR